MIPLAHASVRARRVLLAAGAAVVAMVTASTTAGAGLDSLCDLAVMFLCSFIPIAPDLDSDVDLTQQLPLADPALPSADNDHSGAIRTPIFDGGRCPG